MTADRSAWRAGVPALPAVAYMLLAFAVPLAWLGASSFSVDGGFGFGNYVRYVGDPYYLAVIGRSAWIGLETTLLTLLVAYPAALAMARARPWVQSLFLALVFVPLTVGTIVKTFGWTIVLRRNGIVNRVLVATGLVDAPLQLLFTEFTLVVGMANIFLPYMLLPLFAVMRMIDPRLLDCAATLGAGPLFRFRTVLLPLSLPGIVAGATLVFSLSIAAYVTPLLLVGERITTMSMVIARGFLYVGNPPLGATMAVILLAITAAAVLGGSVLAARGRRP
jgi:putative spermidine/putrescine transport system permease protein